MAFYDSTWYCNAGDQSTTGYYAVAKRPQNTAVVAGQLCRQFTAPAVGSERVFVCIVAGTTANVTDATWTLTRGAKTTDGTATWQECTGASSVNGDATNTPNWTTAKATATPTLGAIIKRNSGASYQICTTAGTMAASEPSFSDTAGVTTSDGTSVWTSLGVVGNFTGGQAPHARLANAFTSTWFAAGNTIYVGANHAESQAGAISMTPSSAAMARILCHNQSGPYPPTSLTTGATVTSAAAISFTMLGSFYFYGISFSAVGGAAFVIGGNTTTQLHNWYYFDGCSFVIATASAGAFIAVGSGLVNASNVHVFNNTTVKFGATSQIITPQFTQFTWQNTGPILVSGSAVPAQLFSPSTGGSPNFVMLEALDLSQLTGKIFDPQSFSSSGTYTVKDCKLNAATSVGQLFCTGLQVQLVRCDSGGTGYKSARYQYEGTETTETSITRVGGAADPTGQLQSRKIVTTANAQWLRPFKAEPYATWNATTGANVTVTVCGTTIAALPNNDDIWLEVEYLGSSGSPLGTIVTTTKSNVLAANAAVSSDGSTWNNAATRGPLPISFDGVSSDMTLSNGNLTATHNVTSTTASGVRGAAVRSSGKYYFEIKLGISRGGNDGFGILLSTGTYNDQTAVGSNTTSVYLNFGGGMIYSNNGSSGKSIGAVVANDVVGIAVDLDNRKGWFRKAPSGNWNGLAIGSENPATNTGGVTIAAGSFSPSIAFGGTSSTSGDNATANFGATSFVGTPPAGFGNWADEGITAFKLTATLSSPQPGMAGYIHARVRAAKASATYYLDPKITLT